MSKPSKNPTETNYHYYQVAYDHFNDALFGGSLPRCLITMRGGRKAYGYFHGDRWAETDKYDDAKTKAESYTDEIALNPIHFGGRTAEDTLSTLVHEMVHLWQHHNGKASQGYHNKQWGEKMKEVGLYPSDTGQEGGKESGKQILHYIIEGGPFAKSCEQFILSEGVVLPYIDRAVTGEKEKKRKGTQKASKTKYTCPSCEELNVWGKPGIKVICGECEVLLECEMPDDDEGKDEAA